MQLPPNRSAQEAALTAVNLAPAAEPSSDSPAPEPSPAEGLTNTHGLLILERTPDGLPSWLACKFCPIFGCRTRKKNYLMLYMAPFKVSKIEAHLAKEHPAEWNTFQHLDLEKKKQFFRGKTLPPPQAFRVRLEQLKKSWCPTKSPKSKKRKMERANVLNSGDSSQRLTKRQRKERVTAKRMGPSVPVQLLSHEEDWIGRIAFKSAITQPHNLPQDQPLDQPDCGASSMPRRYAPLPGKNVYQHLRVILQRYSAPFSRDLHQVVKQPLVGSGSEMRGGPVTPVWTENGKAALAARVLFYLLRGIPPDVASTFLKESDYEDDKQNVDMFDKSITRKNPCADVTRNKEEADVIKKQEDVVMTADMQGLDAPDKPHVLDSSDRLQYWEKFTSTTAISVGMASLLALKRILSERQSWGLVIATRLCPVRKDAIEILIPLQSSTHATPTTPTAPTPSVIAAIQADEPPPVSSALSTGTDLGNTVGLASTKQEVLDKIVSDLISLTFSVWLLTSEWQSEPPTCPGTKMNAWVGERIKMCLKTTLVLITATRGSTRLKDTLRAWVDNKKIHTDWVMANSTDDAAIERARGNYYRQKLFLSDSEWQAEKQVLRGLNICYQKALVLTRGTKFSAILMRAQEVVGRAIADFEPAMLAAVTIPPMPLGPLHVVSVREGNHAVESVIGLLDFVCPQWATRLMGIRTGIPDNAIGKALERELVKAFQARKKSDLEVVDESIPDEQRPIFPHQLAKMTSDRFRELVNNYCRKTAHFEDGFVDKVISQHEVLHLREDGNDGLKKSWTEYEDLKQLMTFIRGLELLWGRTQSPNRDEPCQFSGLVYDEDEEQIVDPEIEHMFRARTLIEIEQTEKLDQEIGRLQANDLTMKDWMIRWGENWSNVLPTVHVG